VDEAFLRGVAYKSARSITSEDGRSMSEKNDTTTDLALLGVLAVL